ncbi:MAG: SUF system NifU family Fe-S cluster assembly protein, partial [Veillonella sp.]|nr:SUF system NifU family Fe-S cluster assembly protein [Veillonella sp.]
MEMDQLYTELILEHNQDKRNKHELAEFTNSEHGHNPSCGDDLTLQLNVVDGVIKDAAYTGSGCAISQASASMMIDLIKGKTVEEALHYVELFLGMIKKDVTDEAELEELEDAMALQNISNMPA